MTDQPTGDGQTAEAPATDAPVSESQEEVVDQQPTQTQESPETDTGKNEVEDQPPKENAAWAAMRAENKRLKEAVGVDPAYLNKLRSATSNEPVFAQRANPVNPDSDYEQVTNSLNWTQQQAVHANNEIANLKNQLEKQQDREAEDAYPELKTDPVFQQIVAEKKLAARVLGHDITTREIAGQVKKLLSRRESQVVAQTEAQTQQRMVAKQAAMAEPKGTTTGGSSTASSEELRQRVRKGDMSAATEVAKGLISDLEF